jgi:hypothetical protein
MARAQQFRMQFIGILLAMLCAVRAYPQEGMISQEVDGVLIESFADDLVEH